MQKPLFVTFYSYKGGVGRTLALGNVAWEAALRGKRVVVIDFDLEAPGIPKLIPFRDPVKVHLEDRKNKSGGLFEFIQYFQRNQIITSLVDFYAAEPIIDDDFEQGGEIFIVPAGYEDFEYKDTLQAFNWEKFYEKENGNELFHNFRDAVAFQFDDPDLVLIDSRTGLTDIGGICTLLLPDKVVVLTGLNDQNIYGCKDVIDTIDEHSKHRIADKHLEPIDIILAASHVPETEEIQLRKKRIKRAIKVLRREIDVTLPYVPILSLEERLLIQEHGLDKDHAGSMVEKYMALYTLITQSSEMIFIPAGEFYFGSRDDDKYAMSNETPMQSVDLPAFQMDACPVTNKQYCEFLKKTDPSAQQLGKWIDLENDLENTRCRIKKSEIVGYKVEEGYQKHPVIYVTWHGADAYAQWAEKRLPTEQEWEKAARGTDARIYPWGNCFDRKLCNTEESGSDGTTEINSFSEGRSPYGCYDMSGNVWEWTSGNDDGEKKFILRGGSWNYNKKYCRCAYRKIELPFNCRNDTGFRCVKSL